MFIKNSIKIRCLLQLPSNSKYLGVKIGVRQCGHKVILEFAGKGVKCLLKHKLILYREQALIWDIFLYFI